MNFKVNEIFIFQKYSIHIHYAMAMQSIFHEIIANFVFLPPCIVLRELLKRSSSLPFQREQCILVWSRGVLYTSHRPYSILGENKRGWLYFSIQHEHRELM